MSSYKFTSYFIPTVSIRDQQLPWLAQKQIALIFITVNNFKTCIAVLLYCRLLYCTMAKAKKADVNNSLDTSQNNVVSLAG
jgi:hypothetical protein